MTDTGWRRNKYGGLFNVNNIKKIPPNNQHMSDKIRGNKTKIETYSENTLGSKRNHKYSFEDDKVVGQLIYDDEGNVESINVHQDYRRRGHATRLYQELQKELGDKDINFGELTDDGKKLIDKIGYNVKEYDKNKYKGRVRR